MTISKSEQKKFLKDLKAKHSITRLDALHDLKKHDLDAIFALDTLIELVKEDDDDMVRFNSLDILSVLAGESEIALKAIQEAAASDHLGVSRKATRLLSKIKTVLEEILVPEEQPEPEEEMEPLSDELFERIETPIAAETSTSPPVAPAVPQPASFQTTTDEQFDESEYGEEAPELSPRLVEEDISNIPMPSSGPPPVPSAPSIPSAGPMPRAEDTIVPEPQQEPKKKQELELDDVTDSPIQTTYTNLKILIESLKEEGQDEEILFYTMTMFNESMDFLKDHLVELIGIEEEMDWPKFMDYKFEPEEEKTLRDLISMVAGVLRDGKVEFSKIETLNFFGTMAQKFEMIEETIVFYVAVVGKDQQNLIAIYNLGLLYAKIGNMDEAIQQFQNILEFEPNNTNTLSKLGDIYLHRRNDYKLASDYYKKVLEVDNKDVVTGLKLAAALSKASEFDEATSVIIKLLGVDESNPDLWLNYAVLLVKQVHFEEALDAYNKALDIAPKNWDFREKAENEKARVEQIINAPEYAETDDESLHYMVDEERKIKVSKLFIFAQEPVDDEVFMAIFDWFKKTKEKYNVPDDLVPKYGSIIDKEQFPIDPLRAQGFAESIFTEQFNKELDLSKFHHELYDLEGYGKIIVFMEEA